jgi:hypothetical protein
MLNLVAAPQRPVFRQVLREVRSFPCELTLVYPAVAFAEEGLSSHSFNED